MRKMAILIAAFAVSLAGAFGGESKDYKPNVQESDIYLPHLNRIPLGGWWKLNRLDTNRENSKNDEGVASGFTDPKFNDSNWEDDLVPNDLNAPFLRDKLSNKDKTDGGVVYYRRSFQLPEIKGDEHAVLCLEDVVGAFTVFINGKQVLEAPQRHANEYSAYKGPTIPFNADITKFVKPGANNITIRLFHSGKPVYPWGGEFHGIVGRLYVDIRPAAWTDRILTTTLPDLKTVEIDCVLKGSDKSADVDSWKGEIFEWNAGDVVAKLAFGKSYERDGLKYVSGKVSIDSPKLWFTESPFLYGVRIRNERGEVVGVQRFGMRTFGVKDGNFVLNGVPVMLRGRCFNKEHRIPGIVYGYTMNAGGFDKNYWSQYKLANNNWIRAGSLFTTEHDILDELGIIVSGELSYPTKRLEKSDRIDEIDVKGIDIACDSKGNLLPGFSADLKEGIRLNYSHPSLCFFSIGNEMREAGRQGVMMNNIYEVYRQTDRQNRPVTSSSGRVYQQASNMQDMLAGMKFDYIDTHDYSGTGNETPLPYCADTTSHFIKAAERMFGADKYPILNGECVYGAAFYYKEWYDPIWKDEGDAEPNWDKYLRCVNQMRKVHPEGADLSLYWVRNWGSKGFKYHRNEGLGVYAERVLENQRKFWPEMDGFAALSEPYFNFPKNLGDFSNCEFKPTEAQPYMQRICAPLVGALDYIAPNQFAGNTIKSKAWAINNHETPREDVRMRLSLEREGKEIAHAEVKFGAMAVGDKKILPFEIKLPDEAGECRLKYTLTSSKGEENSRWLDFKLRLASKVFAPVRTDRKIALFDDSSIYGGLKGYSTIKVFKKLQIPYTEISNFSNLQDFQLLVIGCNSIAAEGVQNNEDAIRKYVENGGRLLVFDQDFNGPIPFLKELSYTLAGPGQFTEILRAKHPMLNGLEQKELFCWNSKDWCIYRTFLTPVSLASVTCGGNTAGWGTNKFGMVNAHLKFGKGDILFTQAEVTENFEKDPAAATLCRNMILAMLDAKTKELAQPFTGNPLPTVKRIADADAVQISLGKAANMGFADDVAGDGKGGWSDQGPRKDMRNFPVGTQRFGGTLFKIVNPSSNNGKSCVVVSSNNKPPFKPESNPIEVKQRLGRIIFLYSGAWIGEKEVGEFVVKYASGATERIPLVTGENISDWTNANAKLQKADCVWSGKNDEGIINAYALDWRNPRAVSDEIESITVKSKEGASIIGLLGMTGEKAK